MESMAVRIIDDLQQLSLLLMFLSTLIFYRYLKKIKRERKLTFSNGQCILSLNSRLPFGQLLILLNSCLNRKLH